MRGVQCNQQGGGGGGSSGNLGHHAAGVVVKAVLTYTAQQERAPLGRILGISESKEEQHYHIAEWGTFSSPDIVPHLPPDIARSPRSRIGGINHNLLALLVCMSKLGYPPILIKVEEVLDHPQGGKFEVCTCQPLFACMIAYRIACCCPTMALLLHTSCCCCTIMGMPSWSWLLRMPWCRRGRRGRCCTTYIGIDTSTCLTYM